jgi:hypothetical protein
MAVPYFSKNIHGFVGAKGEMEIADRVQCHVFLRIIQQIAVKILLPASASPESNQEVLI